MALGKPFNPIIGETFQCQSGNSKFYSEQTSHHPPITHYYVKNQKFTCYGYSAPDASGTGNSITGHLKGLYIVEFPDGGKYQITLPQFYMTGLMFGKRYINFIGGMKIEDLVIYKIL